MKTSCVETTAPESETMAPPAAIPVPTDSLELLDVKTLPLEVMIPDDSATAPPNASAEFVPSIVVDLK